MESNSGGLNSNLVKQWLNLIAIVGAFLVNTLSNFFPINGLSVGEISNRFFQDVIIIPANYAFAIWGVIYLGLISFGVYQVLPAQRDNPLLPRIGYLLVVASLAQMIWIFLFDLRLFTISVVAMVLILLPLIGIYLRLGIGKERVSRKELWLVHIPLSVYLGWISVATIVNVAIALYSINGNNWGFSPQVWTVIMLIAAAVIGAGVTMTDFSDYLIGVIARQAGCTETVSFDSKLKAEKGFRCLE